MGTRAASGTSKTHCWRTAVNEETPIKIAGAERWTTNTCGQWGKVVAVVRRRDVAPADDLVALAEAAAEEHSKVPDHHHRFLLLLLQRRWWLAIASRRTQRFVGGHLLVGCADGETTKRREPGGEGGNVYYMNSPITFL